MNPEATPDPLRAALSELLRSRRTIHDFAPATPPRETVLAALEHARWVPNHHRTEPWRFHLLGPAAVARVVELNTELVRAKNGDTAAQAKRQRWLAMPGWLVVTCRRSEDAQVEREDYAACCCAIHNFSLYLWQAGIGAKWSTGKVTRDPRFLTAIGADPAQEFTVGLVWFGYPQTIPGQSRRPLADVLRDVD
jgi:nitroreductase